MIYYSGLILTISIVRMLTYNLKNKKKSQLMFCIISCLIVSLFQGFRSFTVGTDLFNYIPSYRIIGIRINTINNLTFLNYEPGYVIYNKLLYLLGFDERGFLVITAMIIQIPIFYTIYKNSKNPFFSILIYFAFANFIMTFSGLRQSIAMGLCFFAYKFIKEKKLIYYLLNILLAATFHTSALFCIILYPLYYIKLDRKKIFWMLIFLLFFFISKNKIIQLANIIYYGDAKEIVSTNAYTMLIMYTILLIISYFIDFFDNDYMGLRNFLFLLCLIYAIAPVSNIFTRLGYPISLYLTLFIPKIVENIEVKPSNAIKYILCYIVCIACFFYFLGGLDTLPFSFM